MQNDKFVDMRDKMQDEWDIEGNLKYRMYKLNDLKWNSSIVGEDAHLTGMLYEIALCHTASSRNGGPIAAVKMAGQFISGDSFLLKDRIGIFNSFGELLSKPKVLLNYCQWKLDKESKLVYFGFTEEDVLVIVLSNGKVYMLKPMEEISDNGKELIKQQKL